MMISFDPLEVKWRIGETDPTVIFTKLYDEPSETDDVFLGVMKNEKLAREVVSTHNARLEGR